MILQTAVTFALLAASADPCLQRLPPDLQQKAKSQYVGYRLPLVTDNEAADVTYNRRHGGNGCLGVADGDFDGTGTRDFAFFLTPKRGDVLLIGAFRLDDQGDSRSSKPGRQLATACT